MERPKKHSWNALADKDEIDRDSIGSVFLAKYTGNGTGHTVVIKKLLYAEDEKRLFFKEAKIFHQFQHLNIVQLKGICFSPTAMMLDLPASHLPQSHFVYTRWWPNVYNWQI